MKQLEQIIAIRHGESGNNVFTDDFHHRFEQEDYKAFLFLYEAQK